MRLIFAAILSAGLCAGAAAQQSGGLSTDPLVGPRHHAADASQDSRQCRKDHAGLDLAAAEPAADAEARLDAALKDGGLLVTVAVRDLDCPYCAAAIENAFEARGDIAAAAVNLRTQTISLVARQGDAIPDATIRKIISRRGHEVVSIERGAPPPAEP